MVCSHQIQSSLEHQAQHKLSSGVGMSPEGITHYDGSRTAELCFWMSGFLYGMNHAPALRVTVSTAVSATVKTMLHTADAVILHLLAKNTFPEFEPTGAMTRPTIDFFNKAQYNMGCDVRSMSPMRLPRRCQVNWNGRAIFSNLDEMTSAKTLCITSSVRAS